MNLAALSVRRGVTFAMIFLIVGGFGLFSLSRLRLDLYPDLDFPLVLIVTQYEGASPREIEDLVTRPLEGAVAAVDGVKKVSSTSRQGVSLVNVEFNWGADLNQAEIDVRKYIDLMEGQLPTDAQQPIVFAVNPAMQPVAFLGVRGPYPETKLREITEERIEPLLERVSGIALADTIGGGKREIQVQIDPRRLGTAGVSPTQVVSALRADNVQLPGGTFDQGGWEFTIQTKGKFTSIKQIEEVVVGVRQGLPIRLRDVARVRDSLKEETRIVRINGRPGIMVMVRKQSDANTVQAVRAMKRALPEIERKAGRGVKVDIFFDQGEFVEKSIGNLGQTGLLAILLTFVVLFFFLRRLRPSFIVAASIPLSVLATFSAMDAIGLTLNIISMSGLALAIGMLVDNSIVVQESIFLRAEDGLPPREAAVTGAREVGMAITASTLTTIAVFLPIFFVPGIAGRMFRDMTLTVCISLAVSLVVALTAVPLASSRLLQRQRRQAGAPAGAEEPDPADPDRGPYRNPSATAGDGEAAANGGWLSRSLARLHGWMTGIYLTHLGWVLRHRKKTYLIVTAALVASVALASRLATEFFPKQDTGLVIMQAENPLGSSLSATDRSFRRMEEIIRRHVPEVKLFNMDIGVGEGFIAIFSKGPHSGILRLKLKDPKERQRRQVAIENDLRQRFNKIPGVSAAALQPNLFGSGGDIVVEIFVHDLDQAHQVGMKVKSLLKAIPGTADVTFSLEAGRPEYEVRLQRHRLAALGLNTASVSAAISTVFSGKLASVYEEAGYDFDIRVRGPQAFRRDERNLKNLPIITPTGQVVPLASLAEIHPSVGPATIARQDQQRLVTVTAAVPGKNLGAVLKEVRAKLERFPWPEGITHHIGGTAEDFQDSFRWLAIALLASILLVYMVMASQFESLLHPFLLLFTIPLSFIGVALALFLTGTSLSVTALIGVLILVGIVVNNGIVLVDYINQLRAQGMVLAEAVLEAGRRRLRPVLMTAGTTILGMLPLALELGEGSEGWSPMARTVIGGLITSTALTLLVIPALYLSLESFRERRRARREARRSPAIP